MNTVLVDVNKLRSKEQRGDRRAGICDAALATGARITMKGRDFIRVPRAWWHEQVGAPAGHGVGDHLRTLISHHFKVAICDECLDTVKRMNELGPDGCEREVDALAAEIWSRRDKLEGWHKIAARLPGAAKPAKAKLRQLILDAIARARDDANGTRTSTSKVSSTRRTA